MSSEQGRRIGPWVWAVVAVAAVGVAALLATKDRRREPPPSFQYDITAYQEIDPAAVVFSESDPIPLGIEGVSALAVADDGTVFVAGVGAVAVLNAQKTEAARIAIEGTPTCMAVSLEGDLLLGMTDHIVRVSQDGGVKATWDRPNERALITSIVADADSVYVADAGNRVVLRYDHEGVIQTRLGQKDAARDIPGFVIPSPYFDVAFDNTGAFWVVNPGRHGLEQYRADGALVSAWYNPSMKVDGFCGCCNPSHVAFMSDGTLVTAEKGITRVKIYAVDQTMAG
ncbi:MAG: hypothetical protein GY851_16630, partial [bacterium]|nr:hypothetical protein [bacterium]